MERRPHDPTPERQRMAKQKLPEQLIFLSCDVYSPWSGVRPDGPDHIWADLPEYYQAPLLIYSMYGQTRLENSPFHKKTHFFRANKWHKAQALLNLVIACAATPLIGRAVLLGWGPKAIVRRILGILKGKDPGAVLRHHVFSAALVAELRQLQPEILFYHHEFTPWGSAVELACRKTGVKAIAWQHFALPPDSDTYVQAKDLGSLTPRVLLTVTRHQADHWQHSLPCQVHYGGSRRPTWKDSLRRAKLPPCEDQHRSRRILFITGALDCDDWMRAFSMHPNSNFEVVLHPSTTPTTVPQNVNILEGRSEDLISHYEVVVASSPTPILTLTSARYPHIRVATSQPDGNCHCSSRKVNQTSFLSIYEDPEALRSLITQGCRHNQTDPISKANLLQIASTLSNDKCHRW